MIKRSKLKEFKLQRYNKASSCMNLKDKDEVISVLVEDYDTIFMTTNSGYGLSFKTEEIPLVGVKASGVKGMKLKDDFIVSVNNFSYTAQEFISIVTANGTGKRVRLSEFDLSTRTRRGVQVIREVKSKPYIILNTFICDSKNFIGLKNDEITSIKLTELPIVDRYSTGSQISKKKIDDCFLVAVLTKPNMEQETLVEENEVPIEEEKVVPKRERVSLEEIDDRLMTIDDFLN